MCLANGLFDILLQLVLGYNRYQPAPDRPVEKTMLEYRPTGQRKN